MARFCLHIRDGETRLDDTDGIEAADLNLALEEAALSAREILAELVVDGRAIGDRSFEIFGEDGSLLAVLPFRQELRID